MTIFVLHASSSFKFQMEIKDTEEPYKFFYKTDIKQYKCVFAIILCSCCARKKKHRWPTWLMLFTVACKDCFAMHKFHGQCISHANCKYFPPVEQSCELILPVRVCN